MPDTARDGQPPLKVKLPPGPMPPTDPTSRADALLAEAVNMVVLAAGCAQDRSDRFALIDVRDLLLLARTMLGRR